MGEVPVPETYHRGYLGTRQREEGKEERGDSGGETQKREQRQDKIKTRSCQATVVNTTTIPRGNTQPSFLS